MLKYSLILSSAMALISCQSGTNPPATTNQTGLCFTGGPIYTALDDNPQVRAVAVKDTLITFAGNAEDTPDWCNTYAGENPRHIDLAGHAMYPGFTDAHSHLLGIGLREMTLNLEGSASISDMKSRVADAISKAAPGETVYGRGWIETHWPEGRFPNRADLDDISPNNPVILERADGHAAVVNTAALNAENITADTAAPDGGDILKDENGEPTGMLIDYAQNLVSDLMPKITRERKLQAYEIGAKLYAARGWANTHSMSVDPDNVAIMSEVQMAGNLPIKVYNSVDITNGWNGDVFLADTGSTINTRAIKLYSDGALGSRGAALLAPYDDDPDNIGLMLTDREAIMPVLVRALREGIQINTHAIGDKANRLVLDWYEEAFSIVPVDERAISEPRWRIEHSQIINLEDIGRFKALGVIPSMQPSHAIGDLHFAVDRIGPDRLAGGYAWRSLIDSGSIIAGGSDAPVEVGDPLIEFYAATARKDLKGYSNENWYAREKVSRQEALKMFTIWPAFAAFEEDDTGSIEVGKKADFTVFDQDIMTVSEAEIMTTQPAMTVVDGQIVFEAK